MGKRACDEEAQTGREQAAGSPLNEFLQELGILVETRPIRDQGTGRVAEVIVATLQRLNSHEVGHRSYIEQ
jgi:hypothetical protein